MRISVFRAGIFFAAVIVLTLAGRQAWAQATRVGRTTTARIRATLPTTPTLGICSTTAVSVVDYSTICPSGTGCSCYNIADGTVTGNMVGKGTATMLLNADLASPASTTTSTNGSDTCVPILGLITTSTTSGRGKNATGVTTTFNVIGGLCQPLTNRGNGTLDGGFGVSSSSRTPALSGYGTVLGTVDSKGNLVLTLKGPVS
jgi:hypothetical protein